MTSNLQLVSFETPDRLLLPGLLYQPEKKTDRVAIYLHGNGSSSVFYGAQEMNLFGEQLTKLGVSFFPFNNRGAHWFKKLKRKINNEEERLLYGMTNELIKECVYDIDGAISFLKNRGYKKFILIGMSTGANKAAVYNHYKSFDYFDFAQYKSAQDKGKNPISKYILLSGGDDTGLYFEYNFKKNKKYFFQFLQKCRNVIKKGNGRKLVPKYLVSDPLISYQSLYDTINPDGDYNIFPFNEHMNNLKLSQKPLFKEYKTIDKPTLVVYGELDEYCYGDVPRCVEILKKECSNPKIFTFKIIKDADNGFNGKEKKLVKVIVNWLKS